MEISEVRAYYRAALGALRFVEQRQPTGRRFGADADARWSSLKGDLETADRIDLLIRDADAQWPAAFGARTVFAKRAVSEDEPFGADWSPLDTVDAEDLWRGLSKAPPPASVRDVLVHAARAWELDLAPFDVGSIAPADRIVVAGPSAIASLVEAFSAGRDLDWADQVTVIATPPAHRQLAALAGALLLSTKPSRIATANTPSAVLGARVLVSPDAHPADASRAHTPS